MSELTERFHVVTSKLEFAGQAFEILHPRSADELISEEDFNRDERLPYWAEIWPSAVALAERLAATPAAERGRLLELGCGAGLVTTVAAKIGFSVTATDYYPEALEFVRLNAQHNGCAIEDARLIDWRALPADLGQFDWVVAADVLYERQYAELVAAALATTLKPTGRAVVTDPQRQKAAAFPDFCRRSGLSVDKQGGAMVDSGTLRQTVDRYEIVRTLPARS